LSAKVRRDPILWAVSTGAAANVKRHEVDVVLRGQRLVR
jgi:hypothetical protein